MIVCQCTCLHDSKLVCNSINMYIHVWTTYVHVYTFIDMSVPCQSECTSYSIMYYTACFCYSIIVCTWHVTVCELTYDSMVHTLYIHWHGTDMSVHVYARWSGFQMHILAWVVTVSGRPLIIRVMMQQCETFTFQGPFPWEAICSMKCHYQINNSIQPNHFNFR